MEYKHVSFDIGMSLFDNKRYDTISSGLEKVLTDWGLEDMKVVCREIVVSDVPENKRFQVIIGKEDCDWEKILKEN